jgi:type VI secretion system protein ImpJ
MDELRQLLLVEVERRAFQIPLDTVQKNAAYKAARPDPSLLETATFILAAKAAVPPEMIVTGFPNTVKIAPLEDIRYLVSQALPGITVRALPHVPPHIPRRSGLCYFELDKNSPLWKKLATSSGFAIHIGSNFPDLELEFWATTRD